MLPKIQALIDREYAAQRSDEWLALRGKMLTASDAATAIGVNPYEKPNGLILKKCGENKFTGNAATEHGNKYEDEAREIYCARHNEVSHEIGLFPHPLYPWLGGSPDGITESGKLIEIKCPMRRQILPEVPVHYMPQLQLLMEILDLDVKRDREWFATQLPVMKEFWDKVLWHREHGQLDLLRPKTRAPKGSGGSGASSTVSVISPPVCEIDD
jgi:putative phage-type endonuclease